MKILLKKIRRFFFRILKEMKFLPTKRFAKYLYRNYTGKKLDLENPREFNEKIQWLKVFYHPKILNQLVDKYAVRCYVEEKIGKKYLNEIYGVFDSENDINFDDLPEKFVVKAVHASSFNLIVTDKSKLDIKSAKKLFKKWLRKNQYYRTGQEWAYKDVKPRLIVEKYMKEDGLDSLIDYKFYCFKGKASFIEVHLDRAQNHKRGFYDLNLKKLPFRYVKIEDSIDTEIETPSNLNEMRKLSEILSAKFPFVRVDFYSIKGKTIFGEMTYYPSDGRKDFIPDEYNKSIGDLIELPKIPKDQKYITEII